MVGTGYSKTALSVLSFRRPGDMLFFFSFQYGFPDMGVITMRTISTFKSICWRKSTENGRYPFHVVSKFHVIVPFILEAEWFYTTSNWMIRKCFKFSGPMRVYRPKNLKISSEPLFHHVSRSSLGNFHCIMNANKAHTFLRKLVKFFQVFINRVPSATIR